MRRLSSVHAVVLFLSGLTGLTLQSASAAEGRNEMNAATLSFSVAEIFGDHMVLQRDKPIRIWGHGPAGEEVAVRVGDADGKTAVAEDGAWRLDLPALPAGGPHRMTVSLSGAEEITFEDVLVGEVWFVSGQSNAAMAVRGTEMKEWAKENADIPRLRLNKRGEGWKASNAETAEHFSAVGWYFAHEMTRHLPDVPIGMIQRAQGGTPIRAYMSPEIIGSDPVMRERLHKPWEHYRKIQPHCQAILELTPKEHRPAEEYPPVEKAGPSGCYVWAVDPVAPYSIAGAMWYQGESDAWGFSPADLYEDELRALVADWRTKWEEPELPMVVIQLPNYDPTPLERPDDPDPWVVVQEAQARIAAEDPHVGLAVSIDTGGDDIHPRKKRHTGVRVANTARAMVYGHDVAHQGPTFREMTVKDGTITIHFDHAEGLAPGWAFGDEAPTAVTPPETDHLGFAVAGADRVFHWAKARIEGQAVVLTCDAVAEPAAVRYAFWNHAPWSLVNGAGLPAPSFRTDDWHWDVNRALPEDAWPRRMTARRAETLPTVDGTPPTDLWNDGAGTASDFSRVHALAEAPAPTRAAVRWNDESIYIALDCQSPAGHTLAANAKKHDDKDLFAGDLVEVVIDANGDGEHYHRIAVNPDAAVYEAAGYLSKSVYDMPVFMGMLVFSRYNRAGWDGAYEVAAARRDGGGTADWSVELAIPWKTLGRGAPEPGAEIGIQFVRSLADTVVSYEWTPTGRERSTGAMMPPRLRNGFNEFYAPTRLGRLILAAR